MRIFRTFRIAALAASLALLPALAGAGARPVSEREKFEAEQAWRNGQQRLAEHDQDLRRMDLALRREESRGSRWTNPLVLAIIAAAIAALGNAIVALLNGIQQRRLEKERADASRALEREKAKNQIELERDKAEAQLRLDASKAESDRILEVIKTGESETAAANLQFLLATGLVSEAGLDERLKTYLAERKPGTGPTLPAADGRFRFETGPGAPSETEALETALRGFCDYLDRVGFSRPESEVSIGFEDVNNAYYDAEAKRMIIGTPFRAEPFAAYREYMHHVLMEYPGAPPMENGPATSIESGLADYYPASFMGTPLLGEHGARAMNLPRPYIRNLTGSAGFADLTDDLWFNNGQIWGSLFWDIRQALGQETTDRLLLSAWAATRWPSAPSKSVRAFLLTLLADAAPIAGAVKAIRDRLYARDFPVPRAGKPTKEKRILMEE